MGEGEGSHDLDDGEPGPTHEEQAHKEEDVIVAGEDMEDPELKELECIGRKAPPLSFIRHPLLEHKLLDLPLTRDLRDGFMIRAKFRQRGTVDGERVYWLA